MSDPVQRAARDAAVDWMVRLQAPDASPRLQPQLQQWLAQSPAHRHAWQELQQLQQRFERARAVAARHPGQSEQAHRLLHPPGRRSALRSLAALAVGGAFAAGWADRQFPLRELGADLRTATAQRRRFTLDDGSTVLLDARSAVDVAFNGEQRTLVLRHGRLLLQVAADPRPLLLHSLHARVSLLRGHLLLERDEQGSTAAVLADHAHLHGAWGSHLQLAAGHSARLHAHGIDSLPQPAAERAAWEHGRLVLDNAPLAELVERLRPYRRGFLRVSADAAVLRVQGVFDLDDGDASLAAIAETLPVRVLQHGPVTLIDTV